MGSTVTWILVGLVISTSAQATPSGLLNDTGQTRCLNVTGKELEGCTSDNSGDDSSYPGQDGRYGRDAGANDPERSGLIKPEGSGGHGGFAFTPLDVFGNPILLVGDPPVPAETPRCIWDRVTNLIWEVKSTSGLQNQSNTYGWDSYNTGSCSGGSCNIDAYVNDVNALNLCGETEDDWRVASLPELLTIVDHDRADAPAIDPRYFPNTISGWYWSSTVYATSPAYSWTVNFSHGNTLIHDGSSGYHVRLVRSGQ